MSLGAKQFRSVKVAQFSGTLCLIRRYFQTTHFLSPNISKVQVYLKRIHFNFFAKLKTVTMATWLVKKKLALRPLVTSCS